MVNGCKLNDVLRMVLETMYRGIGFDRLLLALRDARSNWVTGRFGFGADTEVAVKAFTRDLKSANDVFQLAVEKKLRSMITDSGIDNIRTRGPDWHRTCIRADRFMLLLISTDGRCVGLL